MSSFTQKYRPVDQQILNDEHDAPIVEALRWNTQHTKRSSGERSHIGHWIAHLTLASLTILGPVLVFKHMQHVHHGKGVNTGICEARSSGAYMRSTEAFYNDIEELVLTEPFWPSFGPHMTPEHQKWTGAPNPENEELWGRMINGITLEEKIKMGVPTARNIGQPDEFVVGPQVFHDMHCVHMLRHVFWKAINGSLIMDETLKRNLGHYDHCFQMLRQNLECTADLTPLTWHWSKRSSRYVVEWNVERQCRNWDRIMAWATRRNTTGMLPIHVPDRDRTAARLDELKRMGLKMPWEDYALEG